MHNELQIREITKIIKSLITKGPPNNSFLNALKKKLLNIFSNFFFFYLKTQSFLLITENNFIQIAISAVHAVAYTISPISKQIIDCFTYLLNWPLQPFSQDYGLASHITHVVCVNFSREWDLQFNIDSNCRCKFSADLFGK